MWIKEAARTFWVILLFAAAILDWCGLHTLDFAQFRMLVLLALAYLITAINLRED